MGVVARKLEVEHWSQAAGVIRAKDEDGVRVSVQGTTFAARRALSCLVEPEVGDRVLVAYSHGVAGAFVLAVLERTGDAPVVLVSPRATELRVAGRLSFIAEEATIAAPTFSLHSVTTRLQATRVTAIVESVDALLDRIVQRAKQAFRVVDEVDHLRAGRVDYEAKGTMSLHAENTTMTSEGLVKIDGEQIQLG